MAVDRACGARGHARAEREHAGRAGGSDHRVPDRDRQAAPRGDGRRARTATCGSRRIHREGKIAEVNPTTGAVTEFATPTTAGSLPLGIALGPDGNIWFTEFAIPGKIGEINPITHAISDFATRRPTALRWRSSPGPTATCGSPKARQQDRARSTRRTHAFTEFPVTTPNSQPFGIAAGPDGNIWFTEKDREQDRRVINPSTAAIKRLRDPDGVERAQRDRDRAERTRLWFTEQAAAARSGLGQHRAATTMTELPHTASRPRQLVIVPGADGNMWFTEGGEPGRRSGRSTR